MTLGEFFAPMNLTPWDWYALWVFMYLYQLSKLQDPEGMKHVSFFVPL